MQKNPSSPVLVIQSGSSLKGYGAELWRYRELFVFLTLRDVLVRYKQTAVGILWSVLRPLLTMAIFTLVFGHIAKMPADGSAPYALMVFAALMPWQIFANAVQESSNSLVANADMISKVYFPRIIVPLSSVMTALVDFAISFVLFIALMMFYGVVPGWQIVLLPLFLLVGLGAAIGAGLMISALNVSFRDFRYVIPFIVQIGLYVSPVGFSSANVPEQWRLLYALNPMVGVIDGFRWCLLGTDVHFYVPGFLMSLILTVILLVSGFWVFRRMERTFADKI
jgi:lipopolysaccharide transport system permease protein